MDGRKNGSMTALFIDDWMETVLNGITFIR